MRGENIVHDPSLGVGHGDAMVDVLAELEAALAELPAIIADL